MMLCQEPLLRLLALVLSSDSHVVASTCVYGCGLLQEESQAWPVWGGKR